MASLLDPDVIQMLYSNVSRAEMVLIIADLRLEIVLLQEHIKDIETKGEPRESA